MARVNVFLKDDLLERIDAEAAHSGINRSALIQSALATYLEARRREREEAEIRRGMEEACRGMDALADKLGKWDPVKVIREFRDSRSLRVAERRTPYRAKARKGRS
jgi:predicted transcriptional regulator